MIVSLEENIFIENEIGIIVKLKGERKMVKRKHGAKSKEDEKSPNFLGLLIAYLLSASIVGIVPIIVLVYVLMEVIKLPLFLLVALAPAYYVAARWIFNLTLLFMASRSIRPVEEGVHEMDIKNPNVVNWLRNGIVTCLALHYIGFEPV